MAGWTNEIREALRAPFNPAEIAKRPGPKDRNGKQMMLDYVESWILMERLDAVVGPGEWWDEYETVDATLGTVKGRLTIYGVSRQDYGYSNNGASSTDPLKQGVSDCFRRLCARFGMGRDLYGKTERTLAVVAGAPVQVDDSPTGGTDATSAHDDVMGAPATTPEQRTPPARPAGSTATAIQNGRQNGTATDRPATEPQIRAVYAYGRQWWKLPDGTSSEAHVAEMVQKAAKGNTPEQLTGKQANAIITMLKDKIKAASEKGAA